MLANLTQNAKVLALALGKALLGIIILLVAAPEKLAASLNLASIV